LKTTLFFVSVVLSFFSFSCEREYYYSPNGKHVVTKFYRGVSDVFFTPGKYNGYYPETYVKIEFDDGFDVLISWEKDTCIINTVSTVLESKMNNPQFKLIKFWEANNFDKINEFELLKKDTTNYTRVIF
jgi:hypothetical protein